MTTLLSVPEQTRARYPDEEGYAERDGVRVFWERYGEGEPTILLPPTWEIVHSRSWKSQIPYLARHTRVVTFDPRGNGRSDRPEGFDAYRRREFAADAVAVLDAAGVNRAVVVAWCDMGESLLLAAEHPERVAGLVFIAPPMSHREPDRGDYPFDSVPGTDEGWAKETRGYWRRDWLGYLEFFFAMCFTEPHSTKQIEDCVGWALDTDMETVLTGFRGWETKIIEPREVAALGPRVRCPVLVIHGTDDARTEPWRGAELADQLGGRLVLLEGAGHAPHARDPVKVNAVVAEFAGVGGTGSRPGAGPGHPDLDPRPAPAQAGPVPVLAHRARPRPPRPGHRPRAAPPGPGPGDRLARPGPGHPGPGGRGRAHPPGQRLAGERVGPHRVRVGRARPARLPGHPEDGRDPGRQLHGLPRRRPRAALRPVGRGRGLGAGLLPAREPRGEAGRLRVADRLRRLAAHARRGWREAFLTADYNAEMIEHIARFPRLRDRAVFVGNPTDIVPDRFGPGLPPIREWVEGHYDFSGYVTGFDPATLGDRDELRQRLGYRPDEQVCVVTVGGSGSVGTCCGA